MRGTVEKCYMCDREGTTREHVPPFGFFPSLHRENLITVSSCPDHNHKNSKDVEYVRNVIVSHYGTNELAREYFKNKVVRSFDRSPKLKSQTFRKRKPILVSDQETIVYQIEMDRFKLILKAIAYAIYFKDFGESYHGDWAILSPSMVAGKVAFENSADTYNLKILEELAKVPFVEKKVNNPQVFKYHEYIDAGGGVIYKFEFYEGFIVCVFTPTSKNES